MAKENEKVVLINEIGDLGLGITELSEEDQKLLKEQEEKKK